MEVQKTTHYNWTKTLDSMEVGEVALFDVAEIREFSLRSVVSRMKRRGYGFSLKRIKGNLQVTCTKKPEK